MIDLDAAKFSSDVLNKYAAERCHMSGQDYLDALVDTERFQDDVRRKLLVEILALELKLVGDSAIHDPAHKAIFDTFNKYCVIKP